MILLIVIGKKQGKTFYKHIIQSLREKYMARKSTEIIDIRNKVLSNPKIILEDMEVMKVLIDASETGIGGNIVDLRSIAMRQLENQIQKAESTNKSIVAAAYENISSYELIHKAVLNILEARNFSELELQFSRNVQSALKISHIHIMIENYNVESVSFKSNNYISVVSSGEVSSYINSSNKDHKKDIIMRSVRDPDTRIYGEKSSIIKSEAVIALDLGEKKLPASLIMGSTSVNQFEPRQRTELLRFFGSVVERVIRNWPL